MKLYTSSKLLEKTIPVGIIHDKAKKKDMKYVYINDEEDGETEMILDNKDLIFKAYPFKPENQRVSLYITGPAGSGKSYYAGEFLKRLQKLKGFDPPMKDRDIFVFSASEDPDPAFAKIKNLHYLDIFDERIFQLDVKDYENTILVFDDFDSINDKHLKDFLFNILRAVLERGRKLGIDVISILHHAKQGHFTKSVILESNAYICFPKANFNHCSKFLSSYMDYSKKDLEGLKNLNTRSVYINKQAPNFELSEKKIRLL